MPERQQRLRLTAALVTSTAVHAVVLMLLLWSPPIRELLVGPDEPPEAKLIPVSLISRAGGGGGGPLPGAPSAPLASLDMPAAPREPHAAPAAPKPSPPPPPLPKAQAAPQHVPVPTSTALANLRALAPPAPAPVPSAARRAPQPAAPAEQSASLGSGSGDGRDHGGGHGGAPGGGAGTGDGSGGDGSGGARPAYGSNPKPPYPLAARRLGVEGVVTLEVLVRPDGSPAEVHIRTSSGSSLLDDSALETVRARWRFIPAKRGDVPVESRVTFPIRFKLDAS